MVHVADTITVTMLLSTVPWSWASSIPMVCTRAVSFVCGAYACSTDGKEAPLTMDEHIYASQEVHVTHAGGRETTLIVPSCNSEERTRRWRDPKYRS
ncbi:hypothetical protein EV424DRAFT_645267 [Suillus variegatus]|nr:hypothetical protein EV424DRAFT_645267 [Suillus variegatus]